jgi:hypothetical protein
MRRLDALRAAVAILLIAVKHAFSFGLGAGWAQVNGGSLISTED